MRHHSQTLLALAAFTSLGAVVATGAQTRVTSLPREDKPDALKLTSVKYAEEFKANEKDARKKYLNKPVELTGKVTSIALGPARNPMLWLEGAKGELVGVQCMTRDKAPWKKVLPGQTVKLRGKGPEFSLAAALIECDILEVTGDPPRKLTPDALAAEYDKDPEAAMKKYGKTHLVVEGEVAKVTINQFGLAEVTLRTKKAEPRIYLHFTDPEGKRAKDLKAGQKVRALGEFSPLTVGRNGVGLFDSLVLDVEEK